MKMLFGKHKGRELDTLPDSYLRWIMDDLNPRAPANVRPENREEYVRTRRLLRIEAQRILRERRLNGVRVADETRGQQ